MPEQANGQDNAMEILRQLEEDAITVDEAMRKLSGEAAPSPRAHEPQPEAESHRREWWLILLGASLGLAGFAVWFASMGGWWWLLAAPLLLAASIALLLTATTFNAPWMHVQIKTGSKTWPRRITFRLPVPLRLTSWGLKRFGGYVSALDETAIDELLLTLEETVSGQQPISIYVRDDDNGERVEVHLG